MIANGQPMPALPCLAAVALLALATPSSAQSDRDRATQCAPWIAKKGYSRDYVERRTGHRPPPRTRWKDNIRPDQLQVGDVVVVTTWPGHVAVIDEVTRDKDGKPERMRVTSFNYGAGQGWVDRNCEVSRKFGIETTHWVLLTETTGYWRPGLAAGNGPR
jgi:hypothetical protein